MTIIRGTIFLLLITISASVTNAQISKRKNIKIHYSQSDYYFGEFAINQFYPDKKPRFSMEANYGLLKFIEAGIYLGFSNYDKYLINNSSANQFIKKPILFYGLNSNIHLLPLLFKKEIRWADLYLSGKIGAISYIGSRFPTLSQVKPFEYGLYGGIALYPSKYWGLFYEYGTGNIIDSRFGISLKF